jgi:hypothetical protein
VRRNAIIFLVESISSAGGKKPAQLCHISEGNPFIINVSARLEINKEVGAGFHPAYDMPIPFKITAKGYRLLKERGAGKLRNARNARRAK